ncbi:RNA polymerase sigma-54 factor [candidate division KSB1 bacterium]|nr:RNA polymerase factor sigma-54 [candidate division KSB1 bacterium]RQV99809.1 MAG: RNA polymerase sigma-54 factor [candidate division KSB1 bacterium]
MVRLGQHLSLQMRQSPQQVLLSSLLQLPIMSLEQRLSMELEMNPLLEMEQEQELEQEMEETQEKLEDDEDIDEESIGEAEIEKEKEEIDWDEILNDEDNYEFRLPREKNEEENGRVEVHQESLTDYLMSQLHMTNMTAAELVVGEYIIWNINNVGYVVTDTETIAENLEEDVETIERILDIIQGFDPPGIGARNLQECLLIQLYQQNPRHDLAVKMIRDHYEDFKNKRFERLAKEMMIDLDAVKETMEHITKLNPKPGEGYVTYANNYIVPDIEVRKQDGEFKIFMHDFNVPQLRINHEYRKMMLDKKKTSKETRDFIRQRLESARWLINSIHQRRATILRTVEAIIEKQHDFFEKGPENLKPMILKDIADEIGMDISTISRVTNGKYIQTEYGVFELKYFFSEKYVTEDGEDVSNKKIKAIIKNLCDNEPSDKPYNDQKISEILNNEGFPVARRTVAKYREQMNIPVARLRRRI